jgi:hypothetical protein
MKIVKLYIQKINLSEMEEKLKAFHKIENEVMWHQI